MATSTQSIPKSGPKDVFMHLLAFVALYASAVTLMTLLFQYINILYPDPFDFYSSILNSIRYSAAFLVVLYPVFLGMSWLINKDFAENPARREIRVRKWLIYLTLFVSALTVIGDVITLVYNLLGGEFTIRFVLKILVVLVVSGGVFGFYITDIRNKVKNLKMLAWVTSIIVLAVIVTGFVIVGSPARQRALKFDESRVMHLQNIQAEIVTYWNDKGNLPMTLSDLNSSIQDITVPKDPETNADYEYFVKDSLNFQLCANFDLQSEGDATIRPIPQSYPNYASENWSHTAGRVCFDRTIDPTRDKTIPPPIK